MNATLNDLKKNFDWENSRENGKKGGVKGRRGRFARREGNDFKEPYGNPGSDFGRDERRQVKPKTMELIIRLINFGRLGK